MSASLHSRGKSRATRQQRSDDEDEEDDSLKFAESDDIEKPPGLENGTTPPFGVLCMLFDQFESATRNKHKKAGYKGELLGQFISVRALAGSGNQYGPCELILGPAALEG